MNNPTVSPDQFNSLPDNVIDLEWMCRQPALRLEAEKDVAEFEAEQLVIRQCLSLTPEQEQQFLTEFRRLDALNRRAGFKLV